jgi:hypothetical protein
LCFRTPLAVGPLESFEEDHAITPAFPNIYSRYTAPRE